MGSRVVLVLLAVAACSRRNAPAQASRPITTEEASVFAAKYVEAAKPCDEERLSSIIDEDAFRERLLTNDAPRAAVAVALVESLTGRAAVASKLCAWIGHDDDYEFLRVREVEGRPRVVLRKSPGFSASYHELELARSQVDGSVRVADVYSYFKGQWISDGFAELLNQAGTYTDELAAGAKLQTVAKIEQTRPAEALSILDELPEHFLSTRAIQTWRVTVAQRISIAAYADALDELSRRFPDDPSLALLQIDGAVFREDPTGALHYIDLLDGVVGPDPFLDGVRAQMLVMRNGPGDLDLAEAKADNASRSVPGLAIGSVARLVVAVGRHDWTKAVDSLRELMPRFASQFSDAALQSAPFFHELVQSSEYEAWRAQQP